MALKGSKMKLDVRQKIDHVCATSTLGAIGLIFAVCAVNVVLCIMLNAVGSFLISLVHFGFNGYVVGSLNAVVSMARNLVVTLIVFNLILRKDILKLDETVRYVLFLALNYLVYVVSGALVTASTGGYGLSFVLSSLMNYLGVGAVIRFVVMLMNLSSLMRYSGIVMFTAYLLYQCIEIVSVLLCTGWMIRLLSEELDEKGITFKEALLRPFTVHKETELTESLLSEMTYAQESEQLVDTGGLPVSVELVDLYCSVHRDYFGTDKMPLVRNKLMMLSEKQFEMVSACELVSPDMIFIVSCVSGSFGMDRFLLEDKAIGLLKLLTFGCFGILTTIDLLTIRKKAQEHNFMKLMSM